VLHKFERKLERAIENLQEQNQIETIIKQQHIEILAIIRTEPNSKPQSDATVDRPVTTATSEQINESVIEQPSVEQPLSLQEQFAQIPGFEHCFQMDSDGNFKSETAAGQFRRRFRKVYKNRVKILEVFPRFESDLTHRETGIYEIERNRLFLISTGDNCLFITINPTDKQVDFEKAIKEIALPANV